MTAVSIRDLRNKGGEIVDRAAAGERITITRDGVAVAELLPLVRRPLSAAALLERARRLAPMDPRALRRDIDNALDTRL